MYTRFILLLNQFPKLILLAAVLISIFFWDQVQQKLFDPKNGELIIDSTVEPFIERDSGAYQEFIKVRDAFGNEDVLVVALHQPKTGIGIDFIDTLAEISREVREKIHGVIAVTSLLDIPRPPGTCSGKSYFHTLQPGSVCESMLERYRHAKQCLMEVPFLFDQEDQENEELGFEPDEGESEFEAGLEGLNEKGLELGLEENLQNHEAESLLQKSEMSEKKRTNERGNVKAVRISVR